VRFGSAIFHANAIKPLPFISCYLGPVVGPVYAPLRPSLAALGPFADVTLPPEGSDRFSCILCSSVNTFQGKIFFEKNRLEYVMKLTERGVEYEKPFDIS